ncbi:MAG: hypothetical protein LBJ16_02325 [Holosporaceae bacterium]|nr:hypothetical protein [Holosporaceae bacterium]
MVHEDPSTEATQKLPKERMFRKKSTMQKSKKPRWLSVCNNLTWGFKLN